MGLKSGPRGGSALGVKIKTDLSTLSTADAPTEESALVAPPDYESAEGRNGFFSNPLQAEFAPDFKVLLFEQRAGDAGAVTKGAAAAQDDIQGVDWRKDRDRSGREGGKSADVNRPSSPDGSSDSGGAPASTRIAAKPPGMESTLAMIIDSFISKQKTMAA
jgi:hypothetical protein